MVTGVTNSSSPETITPTPQSAAVMDKVGDDVSKMRVNARSGHTRCARCLIFSFFF